MSRSRYRLVGELFTSKGSLVRELTPAEAEAAFAVRLDVFGPNPIPFGALNPEWNRLRAMIRSGDQLWEFKAKASGMLYRGVRLLRKGRVIDAIIAEVMELANRLSPNRPLRRQGKRTHDPWELIEAGHYQEAVDAYTRRLRRERSCQDYSNRGTAYLCMGRYELALADFRSAEKTADFRSDGYRQSVGVAQWLSGQEQHSV